MKAVLLSIQPKWCELIASGRKKAEVRKTRPKLETPFKVYIYCTKDEPMYHSGEKFPCGDEWGNGKVIGEFVCSNVDRIARCGTCNNDIRLRLVDKNLNCKELDYEYLNKCKLSYSDIEKYSNGYDVYAWHISDLVIYDKPRGLYGFCKPCDPDPLCDCDECKAHLGNWSHRIKRPPQSWCYVEEV